MTKYEPILKTNWERYRDHFTINKVILDSLLQPYSNSKITDVTLLSEGCANSNYKVEFITEQPVVLRIYLREKNSLAREMALHKMLANQLPVPEIFYSDDTCILIDHPYAIMEFVDGELMRNVILSKNESSIKDCAFSAGVYLNHLRNIKLSDGGFFQDGSLTIRPFNHDEEYLPYAYSCLDNINVRESLGEQRAVDLRAFLEENQQFLPGKSEANLTHADYDPANMLVKKIDARYQVIAILDWEFAFSGSYLMDIGMFLRYSHKLPEMYETNFIKGIVSEGGILPKSWKKSVKLMDMICLLSLLYWNPKKERPNLSADVTSLIQNTLNDWRLY
ncbi:MAG: aminoglycoside phosphotransferase family protein [Legionellaceae bacterium]|nr:aminoglycoside phosphotransferase family protein [Legionellaceae bacterium]